MLLAKLVFEILNQPTSVCSCPAYWYLESDVLCCVCVISRPTVDEALCVTE